METTKEMLAEKLNGCDRYGITDIIKKEAKESGLVIVYGYSDDNMEFEGAISEEVGAYDGGEAYFMSNGKFPSSELMDLYMDEMGVPLPNVNKIVAKWEDSTPEQSEKYPDLCWSYETTIPHAIFEMVDKEEDNKAWCLAIVFSKYDLV